MLYLIIAVLQRKFRIEVDKQYIRKKIILQSKQMNIGNQLCMYNGINLPYKMSKSKFANLLNLL